MTCPSLPSASSAASGTECSRVFPRVPACMSTVPWASCSLNVSFTSKQQGRKWQGDAAKSPRRSRPDPWGAEGACSDRAVGGPRRAGGCLSGAWKAPEEPVLPPLGGQKQGAAAPARGQHTGPAAACPRQLRAGDQGRVGTKVGAGRESPGGHGAGWASPKDRGLSAPAQPRPPRTSHGEGLRVGASAGGRPSGDVTNWIQGVFALPPPSPDRLPTPEA